MLDLTWDEKRKVYLIKRQNDLYQFNEWVKFISPFNGFFIVLVQYIATAVCVLCAAVFLPITLLEQRSVETKS